jgi:hypothetical protein
MIEHTSCGGKQIQDYGWKTKKGRTWEIKAQMGGWCGL